MSIQVSTFNDKELKAAIKVSPAIVQEYITAQQHVIDGYKSTLAEAMKKIFELSAAVTAQTSWGEGTDDSSLGAKMLGHNKE
jgi:hypothetical protein